MPTQIHFLNDVSIFLPYPDPFGVKRFGYMVAVPTTSRQRLTITTTESSPNQTNARPQGQSVHSAVIKRYLPALYPSRPTLLDQPLDRTLHEPLNNGETQFCQPARARSGSAKEDTDHSQRTREPKRLLERAYYTTQRLPETSTTETEVRIGSNVRYLPRPSN